VNLDKAAWKVVSPPPVLPIPTADALLAGWRGASRVVLVEALEGGLMNWNYKIRLSGSPEQFVLRFYDRDPSACAREARILSLVRGDVPVPQVMFGAADGAAGFPPFCVLEFIEGISLRELRRNGDAGDVAAASYDAGRLLPLLARHQFNRSGMLSPECAVTDGPFAGAGVVDVIEHFVATPLFQQRVDASLAARLLAFARRNEDGFGKRAEGATLVHGDFNSPNILVRADHGTWRVAAILDWEFAFAGSMLCDVGNMLRYERPGHPRYEPPFSRAGMKRPVCTPPLRIASRTAARSSRRR